METDRNEYKARASRLRAAIQNTLGVDCTSSQALELIAKQENFQNWDALSGTASKTNAALVDVQKLIESGQNVVISGPVGEGKTTRVVVVEDCPELPIKSLSWGNNFVLTFPTACRILIVGTTGSGKSLTANALKAAYQNIGIDLALLEDATPACQEEGIHTAHSYDKLPSHFQYEVVICLRFSYRDHVVAMLAMLKDSRFNLGDVRVDEILNMNRDGIVFSKLRAPTEFNLQRLFVSAATDSKDLANPVTADTILANCSTKIFLPSAVADKQDYKSFGVSQDEVNKVIV